MSIITYRSSNLLTNGNAEAGTLSGWSASSVSISEGGETGSYCFAVPTTGEMSQNIVPSSGQVYKNLLITGKFLPENEITADNTENKSLIECKVNYSDNSRTLITVPTKNLLLLI